MTNAIIGQTFESFKTTQKWFRSSAEVVSW